MSNDVKILIVEDEFLGRVYLKNKIIELGFDVCGEAKNTEEAIEIIKNKEVDVAILDINLGQDEKNGIWLGNFINENYKIPFIYLTAYGTSTVINNAIESLPSSYLVKPFKIAELEAAINIATKNRIKKPKVIKIKLVNSYIKIKATDIDYIETNGNYLKIIVGDKIYQHRCTLKKMKSQLNPDVFKQAHRAFLVNSSKIQQYTSTYLLINDIEIPISIKFKDNFK